MCVIPQDQRFSFCKFNCTLLKIDSVAKLPYLVPLNSVRRTTGKSYAEIIYALLASEEGQAQISSEDNKSDLRRSKI
jgi:hypothetical protein